MKASSDQLARLQEQLAGVREQLGTVRHDLQEVQSNITALERDVERFERQRGVYAARLDAAPPGLLSKESAASDRSPRRMA